LETNLIIRNLADEGIEMTERKGIGHPDTVCDEVTEQFSILLCKQYLKEFGVIMHHNVDKALLIAGQSKPLFWRRKNNTTHFFNNYG
jgi:S-adenosylmethionine synthetase